MATKKVTKVVAKKATKKVVAKKAAAPKKAVKKAVVKKATAAKKPRSPRKPKDPVVAEAPGVEVMVADESEIFLSSIDDPDFATVEAKPVGLDRGHVRWDDGTFTYLGFEEEAVSEGSEQRLGWFARLKRWLVS